MHVRMLRTAAVALLVADLVLVLIALSHASASTVRSTGFETTDAAPPAPRRAAAWKVTVAPIGNCGGTTRS